MADTITLQQLIKDLGGARTQAGDSGIFAIEPICRGDRKQAMEAIQRIHDAIVARYPRAEDVVYSDGGRDYPHYMINGHRVRVMPPESNNPPYIDTPYLHLSIQPAGDKKKYHDAYVEEARSFSQIENPGDEAEAAHLKRSDELFAEIQKRGFAYVTSVLPDLGFENHPVNRDYGDDGKILPLNQSTYLKYTVTPSEEGAKYSVGACEVSNAPQLKGTGGSILAALSTVKTTAELRLPVSEAGKPLADLAPGDSPAEAARENSKRV